MFGTLKELILINVQVHEQTLLKFNKFGIHRIKAEGNSHGKTSIMRSLDALFMGENLDSDSRHDIIRWGCESAIINATSWNGFQFRLYLHNEYKYCFYEAEYEGKKIRKYLGDDYHSLVKSMNFHNFDERDFSLHRYKTKTALPFTNTSGRLNYEIITSSTGLSNYESMMEELNKKLDLIKLDKSTVESRLKGIDTQLRVIGDTNIVGLELKITSLEKTISNYKALTEPVNLIDEVKGQLEKISNHGNGVMDIEKSNPIFEQLNLTNDSLKELNSISDHMIKIESESKRHHFNKEECLEMVNALDTINKSNMTIKTIQESIEVINRPVLDTEAVKSDFNSIISLNSMINDIVEMKRVMNLTDELQVKELKIDLLDSSISGIGDCLTIMDTIHPIVNLLDLVETIELNLSSLESEIEGMKENLPHCDKCGSILNTGEVHCA